MKLKKLFVTAALALGLGVGAVAGISANQKALEAKADPVETIDIYFSKPSGNGNYGNVNIYYTVPAPAASPSWPGYAMEYAYRNEAGQDVMKYSVPSNINLLIFSGDNGDQTVDITSGWANNKGYYLKDNGTVQEGGKRPVLTWDVEFYTISYNANGGEGTMSDVSAVCDVSWGVGDCAFTREGYEFSGWNTEADGSGDAYVTIAKDTMDSGDVVQLYAQWTEVEYYIVGNLKGNWSEDGDGAYKLERFKDGDDVKYKAENVTFAENEEWKIKKRGGEYFNNSYDGNKAIFYDYMEIAGGNNVKVKAAGVGFHYSIYVTVNSDYNATEVWTAFFYNAEKFATEFLAETDAVCDTNYGTHADGLKTIWGKYYAALSNYPGSEQNKLHDASANESGTVVERAMARYDSICKIYGTALEADPKTYDYNFLGRSSANAAGAYALRGMTVESSNAIIVAAIVLVASLSIVGVVFAAKKRKNNYA